MPAQFLNIAFYKFVRIDDPRAERIAFLALCGLLNLRGTVLFAHEGINSCLSGTQHNIAAFIAKMRADPRFADIDFKESPSEKLPFNRLLVKVKAEIVTMGMPGIDPAHFTGEYVEPLQLKAWLDAGEDVILVDTRNDYEVRLGTFRRAINPDIKTFRTFPEWVDRELAQSKGAKVVTFCTGGIRCEKATAYMRQCGFENVHQLQGGILKYFEETKEAADAHYDGACFVFDGRVAVDRALAPAPGFALCFACRMPLSAEDLASPAYVPEHQCPHCIGKVEQRSSHRKALAERNSKAALERRRERSQRAKAGRSKT